LPIEFRAACAAKAAPYVHAKLAPLNQIPLPRYWTKEQGDDWERRLKQDMEKDPVYYGLPRPKPKPVSTSRPAKPPSDRWFAEMDSKTDQRRHAGGPKPWAPGERERLLQTPFSEEELARLGEERGERGRRGSRSRVTISSKLRSTAPHDPDDPIQRLAQLLELGGAAWYDLTGGDLLEPGQPPGLVDGSEPLTQLRHPILGNPVGAEVPAVPTRAGREARLLAAQAPLPHQPQRHLLFDAEPGEQLF
jgi:hypothetical protein